MEKYNSEVDQTIKENESITLVCGADDKFAMPLAVTLYSALANLSRDASPNVYIIESGISQNNKKKIAGVLEKAHHKLKLNWLTFDIQQLSFLRETTAISKAAYLRILIADLLPQEITKVIYLDCDMIIEADLMKLWELNFTDEAAMGVQDFYIPFVSATPVLADFNKHTSVSDKNPVYCNSGMMVLNLSYWRKHQLSASIFAYLKENDQALDQDGINMVIKGNWKLLDPCWNVTLSSVAGFGKGHQTSQEEIEYYKQAFKTNPYIIHFTSKYKPWHSGAGNKAALNNFYYDQYYLSRFYSYLRRSKWFHNLYFACWLNYRRAVLLIEFKIPRRLSLLKQSRTKQMPFQNDRIINEN